MFPILAKTIENWDDEIFPHIQTLADHPDMGRMVPEFDQTFLRELIHRPFRFAYRLHLQRVGIVRVWRSERLLHLAAEDDEAP